MENKNVFIKVGTCYHNDSIPVISDGKYFFTLELCKNGVYTDCLEVADKNGLDKNNCNHTEAFEPIYENGTIVGYRMI